MGMNPVNSVSAIRMISWVWYCTKRIRVPNLHVRDGALSRVRDILHRPSMMNGLVERPTDGRVPSRKFQYNIWWIITNIILSGCRLATFSFWQISSQNCWYQRPGRYPICTAATSENGINQHEGRLTYAAFHLFRWFSTGQPTYSFTSSPVFLLDKPRRACWSWKL